jgi:hypothetical protein
LAEKYGFVRIIDFDSFDFSFSLPNLLFAKLDVGRYPKEGERFRINTHVMSKQLPSIAVIRNGKQINRRPAIGSNGRAIPFKFTEVKQHFIF